MRKQAAVLCLRVLNAILWSPNRGDISLQMGLRQGVAICLLASEIQNGGESYWHLKWENSKAAQFRGFGGKSASFAINVRYPGWHSWCALQFPRNFQTDVGSLDLYCREKVMEQTILCWFAFSVILGILPTISFSGKTASEKWPPSKDFPAVCLTKLTVCGGKYLPLRKERHQLRVCFLVSRLQELFSF